MEHRASSRNASGTVIISSEIGEVQADTAQCVHCQKNWIIVRGSGRIRGYCQSCGGPTCGGQDCYKCDHFMRKIERAERR